MEEGEQTSTKNKNSRKYIVLLSLVLVASLLYLFYLLNELNIIQNENQDIKEEVLFKNDTLDLERKRIVILEDSIQKLDSIIFNLNNNKETDKHKNNSVWHNKQEFYFFKVNLKKNKLKLDYSKTEEGLRFKDLKKEDLLFATNGGIFEKNYIPTGLLIKEGEEINNLNLESGSGNFYLKPNGVFYINEKGVANIKESLDFSKNQSGIWQGIQSGPLLLNNGEIHEKFNKDSKNKYIRNGVGLIDGNTIVFIISVKPVNFYSFAEVFQQKFNCKKALYLDGSISGMYIKDAETNNNVQNFSTIISVYHGK